MKIVKLTTPSSVPPLKRQTPNSSLTWGNYKFIINEEIEEADYWIVGDELSAKEVSCRCARENVFLTTGESAYIKLYSRSFTKQFAKVFSFQRNLFLRKNTVKSLPMLPWFAGAKQVDEMKVWDTINYLDYDFFVNDTPVKTINRIAVVTSNKRLTKGHCRRLDFICDLQKALPGIIDLYGNGFIPIADKYPVLSQYKYQLVIENSCYPSYITEKLADAYLCECYPFYIGAKDVADYFPADSFCQLDINDVGGSISKIKKALQEDAYPKYHNEIKKAKDLILNKYNIFPTIVDIIEKYGKENRPKEIITLTNKHDLEWKISMRVVNLLAKFVE